MVHVGLMVVGAGAAVQAGGTIGLDGVGAVHLFAHAWAKAALFLAVGVALHGWVAQDLRAVSAWTGAVMAVGGGAALAVAGGCGSAVGATKEAVLGAWTVAWGVGGAAAVVLTALALG